MLIRILTGEPYENEIMAQGKLTQAQVATLPTGLHSDGEGLYLQIQGNGRSWIYRYQLNGKVRWHGLGSARDVTLAAARKARNAARVQVKNEGVDVVQEARRERRVEAGKAMTFKAATEAYISGQAHTWKSAKHATQWTATLQAHAYPIIGTMPVAEIARSDIIKVLEPIWLRTPQTARRLRGRIEAILDWCIARGDRPDDLVNPASRGPILRGLPKQPNGVKHHAALPYAEAPAFLKKLRERAGMACLALEFAILTAARTSEVIGAKWSEINRMDQAWEIPGERMKAGRSHRVPLTDAVMKVLDATAKEGQGALIFPNAKGAPLSNMSLLAVLKRMSRSDVTTHGFRAAFKTWSREETDFDGDLSEAALAHVIADKTQAAYERGTMFGKRRALMEAWADYCG
jgi:integrase